MADDLWKQFYTVENEFGTIDNYPAYVSCQMIANPSYKLSSGNKVELDEKEYGLFSILIKNGDLEVLLFELDENVEDLFKIVPLTSVIKGEGSVSDIFLENIAAKVSTFFPTTSHPRVEHKQSPADSVSQKTCARANTSQSDTTSEENTSQEDASQQVNSLQTTIQPPQTTNSTPNTSKEPTHNRRSNAGKRKEVDFEGTEPTTPTKKTKNKPTTEQKSDGFPVSEITKLLTVLTSQMEKQQQFIERLQEQEKEYRAKHDQTMKDLSEKVDNMQKQVQQPTLLPTTNRLQPMIIVVQPPQQHFPSYNGFGDLLQMVNNLPRWK